MVLFYFSDQEIMDLVGLQDRLIFAEVLSHLDLELKLLVLLVPIDDFVVIPPTHLAESFNIWEKLLSMNQNRAYLRDGCVRSIMAEPGYREWLQTMRYIFDTPKMPKIGKMREKKGKNSIK